MELFKNFINKNYDSIEAFSKTNAVPFLVSFINFHSPGVIRNNIIYRRTRYKFSHSTPNGDLKEIVNIMFRSKTRLTAQSLGVNQQTVRYYLGRGAIVYQNWLYRVDFKLDNED